MPSPRVVLVTGSSAGGLGYEICKEFRAEGYRVFATSRKIETIESLEAEGCDLLVLDVTKPESIAAAAKELSLKTGGRLDILINNAGVYKTVPSIVEDPSSIRSIIDTNLVGPIFVGQAFIPLIIKSNEGKGGVVVNVSSIQAITAVPWAASYAASKAGIRSISSSWRMELKNFGISVMDVVAGGMNTATVARMSSGPEESATSKKTDWGPYWNWAAIDAHRQKTFASFDPVSPVSVAKDIVAAATKKNPPADLYSGTAAWIFRYIPHFPLNWFESMFGNRHGAGLVSYRP